MMTSTITYQSAARPVKEKFTHLLEFNLGASYLFDLILIIPDKSSNHLSAIASDDGLLLNFFSSCVSELVNRHCSSKS